MINFEIDDEDERKLDEWKQAIKVIYGDWGTLTYKFSYTGIGVVTKVHSDKTDTEINLTDVNKW